MNKPGHQIATYGFERERLSLDSLAARAGLHPELIERFIDYGLIEPSQRAGAQMFFDFDCVLRLRKIERLRHDLGANLAGVAVILDLLDRLTALQREIESLRRFAP